MHSDYDKHVALGEGYVLAAPKDYVYLSPKQLAEQDQQKKKNALNYEDMKYVWKCEVARGDKVIFRRFLRSGNHQDNLNFHGIPGLRRIMDAYPHYELCLLHPKDILGFLEDEDAESETVRCA